VAHLNKAVNNDKETLKAACMGGHDVSPQRMVRRLLSTRHRRMQAAMFRAVLLLKMPRAIHSRSIPSLGVPPSNTRCWLHLIRCSHVRLLRLATGFEVIAGSISSHCLLHFQPSNFPAQKYHHFLSRPAGSLHPRLRIPSQRPREVCQEVVGLLSFPKVLQILGTTQKLLRWRGKKRSKVGFAHPVGNRRRYCL
jgi:hypothetical protein